MTAEHVLVRVELMNDDGRTCVRYGRGEDVAAAIVDAEEGERDDTGDDSWTMNEWDAA